MAKSTTKRKIETAEIVNAVILLALGVLFCFKIAATAIGIMIGVAMTALGLLNLILMARNGKSFASLAGIANSALIAVGIVFIAKHFLSVFLGLIPYILIVVGFVIMIDAFLARFVRKAGVLLFVIELVVAVACIALGFCLLFVDGFAGAASIVFGVFLILLSIYLLIGAFKKK